MNKTITIHQPNFFPWYPFFQKMNSADLFVILENCQFEKNNFQNRFNLNNKWYTMSTSRHLRPIVEKRYLNFEKDWFSIKNRLPEYLPILEQFDGCMTENLSETNTAIIKKIKNDLKIDTKIVRDYTTHKKGTSRLVDICKQYNAKTYISGISGKKYLNIEEFENSGIEVVFQNEQTMIKEPILQVLKKG